MHPRRSGLTRLAPVILALGLALGLTPAPTAVLADSSAEVSTDPTGAQVVLTRRDTWVEVGPPRTGGGGRPGTGCRRRWRLAPTPHFLSRLVTGDYRPLPLPPAPSPEHRPYHVFCDAAYVTTVWLRPSQFGAGPAIDPRSLAQRLVRDLPYPPAAVGASPALRGLTGLESWFWVEGYSSTPLRDAVEGFGLRVEVEALPAAVTWDFGDGTTPVPGTLGQAAPARSDVVHVFERRSRVAPFTVRAAVRLDVRWRQNGGAWQPLAPVLRSAARPYLVAESRAVLIPPG